MEPRAEGETSLPELKFTNVLESQDPAVSPDSRHPIVQPYRDYTLVLGDDTNDITILDSKGERVEGLNNTQTMIVDWDTLKGKGTANEAYSIRKDWQYRSGTKNASDFPKELQPFIQKFLGSKDYRDFPKRPWQLNTEEPGKIRIATEKDYVVLFSELGTIAFQTQSENGVPLPPRNWKRFDSRDVVLGTMPDGMAKVIERFKFEAQFNYSGITENGYLVGSGGDELTIFNKDRNGIVFTDRIKGVDNNICEDPKTPGVIYYCTTQNPKGIFKIDTNSDPKSWHTETIEFPKTYSHVDKLRLDPTGNFFTFQSGDKFVAVAKDILQQAGDIPGFRFGSYDEKGRISGIDDKGRVKVYDPNFKEAGQQIEERRIARIAQGLAEDLFKKEASEAGTKIAVDSKSLEKVKMPLEARFNEELQKITDINDITSVLEALAKVRIKLKSEGLGDSEIEFITKGIEGSISGRQRVLAAPIVAQGLEDLSGRLAGNLTIALISEARGDIAKLKSLEGLVDDATRAKIRALENQLNSQSAELFRTEGAVVEKDVGDLVDGVRGELEKMTSMPDFADWQEFRLPQLISRLGSLANDTPLEASETQKKILAARRQLQDLSRQYGIRFKEQYDQVRQRADEMMGERVELLKVDIDSFADRLRERGFKTRPQAEKYIGSSDALEALKTEISELQRQNPDAAKELDKALKVKLATIMSEIERGGLTTIAETGQQMILFGNTLFPRSEAKVKERLKRQMDLIFIPDEKSKGPGVTADKILGDIGIMEINSRGILQKRRLYQGMSNEDKWRYGSVSYRGEYIFPSYINLEDFRKIKEKYADWVKGDDSKIRQDFNAKREALKEWYKKRQKIGKRKTAADTEWAGKYKELLKDYASFSKDNYILTLIKVDQLRNAPETEFANGSGYVPEWRSEWTTDETTEHYLEEMAQMSKMQLDLQEGLLNLKGHAGTGKDVLVQMFANRTNRPYFTIDCSKWTTEFELSEDVVLGTEEEASKMVKVPSVVLNAITTPGAVMYFNEINAMPEQAQIFLHGLMDFKRRLTLKTSSGKTVKALDSVLLIGSMNPGYAGTFNPQFATKSRMVELEINYPALYREKDPNDPNPNPPISASEALRVARQVDSLADFTYEANPQHNEFVQIWDRYINGIQNGAPDLTPVQRFDVEAILTMVEFAQKLREGFILKFEKARASSTRGVLLVDQPITGRDMGRMAYFLNKMSEEEKATANPEAVARSLIERFFLRRIDKRDEREEIRTAMATWTSFKRFAA